jgi:iron complex outermembrane recepter protein
MGMIGTETRANWREVLMAGVSVAALCISSPLAAQETPTPAPGAAPAAGEEPASDKVEKVTVTGTRLKKDEFTSPSPVQIIDPEKSEKQGTVDTATTIQGSSVSKGSAQITSALSSAFVTNGGPGTATVSLRGLGDQRTLVLLNGRRAGPAGIRGAVGAFDLNVIPQSAIESVQILKDGASSIYGSDAVAGVVNIITKKSTDGIELDGFYSQPFEEGGEEQRYTARYGDELERGHFQISLDYYKRSELAEGDREYLSCGEDYVFSPAGARLDRVDPRTGSYQCRNLLWGHLWLYDFTYFQSGTSNLVGANGRPVARLQYNYAGDNLQNHIPSLADAPFAATQPGHLAGPAGWFPVGYDGPSYGLENWKHPFYAANTVIPETTRYTLYADGAYQLTNSMEVFGELLFNRRETYQNASRQFWNFNWTNDTILPPIFEINGPTTSTGDPLPNGFTGDAFFSPTAITDWADNSQKVDYIRAVGGARGEFGDPLAGWEWELVTQYSRSEGTYWSQQILDDAIDSQDFRTELCAPGELLPISQRPCIDINWTDPEFLRGNLTPQQRAFLFDEEEGRTIYTQLYVEGVLTGSLFDLPAGSVDAAIGATVRRDEINDTPGPITLAGNVWGGTSAGITKGSSYTTEYFGEVDIPLIADAPFAKYFNLRMSGRWTEVSTVDDSGTETYKIGANWQVNNWLRFRGTYGTSFRAPALFELYLADQTSFVAQADLDPCIQWANNLAGGLISQAVADNCAADGIPGNFIGGAVTGTVFTGGGLGVLKPETSVASSVSVVLTPDEFLPESTNVSLAIDYYEIEVEGEVAQLGAGAIILGCYEGTDPAFCALFTRGTTAADLFSITEVRDSFVNINSQTNRGIDVTARVRQELPDGLGDLTFVGQMSWQFEDTLSLFGGVTQDDNGEEGEPEWVGNFTLEWASGEWSVLWGVDAVQHTSDADDYIARNGALCRANAGNVAIFDTTTCRDFVAESVVTHSLSLTREFDDWSMTFGVANLLDTEPPQVSRNSSAVMTHIGTAPFTSNYDYVGRRGFLSISKKF